MNSDFSGNPRKTNNTRTDSRQKKKNRAPQRFALGIQYAMNMAAAALRPKALSLTGSGHLLIYQLGACKVLLEQQQQLGWNIRHVVGASGGAIAATVVTQIPHKLDEYATEFATARGKGIALLKEVLQEESTKKGTDNTPLPPELHIATTRCCDGKGHSTSFSNTGLNVRDLLETVEASCRIPSSFHPWDIFSTAPVQYAEHEGIILPRGHDNNNYSQQAHVDGGIATPAPPTPNDGCDRLIVSPVAGPSSCDRISPIGGWGIGTLQAPVDLGVQLSWANLRALRATAGLVTTAELLDWYQRGQDDADIYLRDHI